MDGFGNTAVEIDWREKWSDRPVGEIFEVDQGPTAKSIGRVPGKGVAYITDDGRLFYVELGEGKGAPVEPEAKGGAADDFEGRAAAVVARVKAGLAMEGSAS